MPVENVETFWDFILLYIHLVSIFFVWYGCLGWRGKHQANIKERLREPDDEENVTDQRIFGYRFGTIVRNAFYILLISCAAYITITIVQTSKF